LQATSHLLSFAFGLALTSLCSAQEFKMNAVELMPSGAATGQVLGKAVPAKLSDWPATFTFKNAAGAGCTATAVGQRVILTAAHCVTHGSIGTVATKSTTAQVQCSHHPNYPADISNDFALCVVSGTLPKLGYEQLNADAAILQEMPTVILLGYGCLQPGGVDRNFGTLYQGAADLISVPKNDNFILASGDAAVCFGDSGGGAFSSTDPASRRLIGVNSRGDISRTSWLASTTGSSFLQWAKQWSAELGVMICGLSTAAQGCNG